MGQTILLKLGMFFGGMRCLLQPSISLTVSMMLQGIRAVTGPAGCLLIVKVPILLLPEGLSMSMFLLCVSLTYFSLLD